MPLPLPLPLPLPRSTAPRCRKCLPEVAGKSGSNSSCNATPAHTRTGNTQVIIFTARMRGRESEQRESEIKVSSCKFLVSFPLFLGIRWQFAAFQPLSTVEGYPVYPISGQLSRKSHDNISSESKEHILMHIHISCVQTMCRSVTGLKARTVRYSFILPILISNTS